MIEYSFEWYTQNLPEGITIHAMNQTRCTLYLKIDPKKYPTKMDQMGIINWIELCMKPPTLEIFYSSGADEYINAYGFRERNGYDNQFFETEKRFSKIKKDDTYYVKDNKLDTCYPVYEIKEYSDFYSDESVDYLIEKLNQEGFDCEREVLLQGKNNIE